MCVDAVGYGCEYSTTETSWPTHPNRTSCHDAFWVVLCNPQTLAINVERCMKPAFLCCFCNRHMGPARYTHTHTHTYKCTHTLFPHPAILVWPALGAGGCDVGVVDVLEKSHCQGWGRNFLSKMASLKPTNYK